MYHEMNKYFKNVVYYTVIAIIEHNLYVLHLKI